MGSGMSASNNFRKLVLTDVEKDVKRWKEAIDYVENRKSCDQRTMRILRQMMIETILLMHDIQKTKRKNITQSSTKSWLDIRMAEIDVSSTYLITGLRELVYQWDATIRRTREGGPKDDLWNMILTTDQRMRKYLSDQAFFQTLDNGDQICVQTTIESLKSENARLKEENENLKKELKGLQLAENENAARDNKFGDTKLTKIKLQLQNAESEVKRLKSEVQKRDEEIRELNKIFFNQAKEVKKLQSENDHLITRLSKIAGEQLSTGNPNIADLSDMYRPTKLGEMYSELYDNEWTDAFEGLSKAAKSEMDAIKSLQWTLEHTHEFCSDHYQTLVGNTSEALNFLVFKEEAVGTQKTHRESTALAEEGYRLQQVWKATTKGLVRTQENCQFDKVPRINAEAKIRKIIKELSSPMFLAVKNAYLNQFWDDDCIDAMKPYISKCLLVSWMMVVQDPQMCFGEFPEKNALFDSEMYKAYTKFGNTIDYVLWPCLLLHKGGNLVAKGVAQGKNTKLTDL